MTLNERIQPLFAGWQEALIWSCLQGCMGSAAADDPVQPQSARITVGDFCFFCGQTGCGADLRRGRADFGAAKR